MFEQRTKGEASCPYENRDGTRWSIERQVRIATGLIVLLGIALAYVAYPPFIWLAILVALGMVISGVTNSCALGLLIMQLPWNRSDD